MKHRCTLTAYIVNLININIIEQINTIFFSTFFYRSSREAMQLSRGLAKLSLKTPVSLILYLTCVFVLQDFRKDTKIMSMHKKKIWVQNHSKFLDLSSYSVPNVWSLSLNECKFGWKSTGPAWHAIELPVSFCRGFLWAVFGALGSQLRSRLQCIDLWRKPCPSRADFMGTELDSLHLNWLCCCNAQFNTIALSFYLYTPVLF